jgi:Zn-dependent peptidase ImmA (M78 family)
MPFRFKNFQGVEYEIVLRKPHPVYDAIALCQDPSVKNPKIYIDPDRSDTQIIADLMHELTHAFFWKESETKVTKFSNNFSRLLREIRKEIKKKKST